MAVRSVVKRGDPRLERRCRKIVDFAEVAGVIRDLRDTLDHLQSIYNYTRGSGIAAPQIGEALAASFLRFDGKEYVLCNPHIVKHSDQKIDVPEGCLSFFDVRGSVPRWARITVEARDEHGQTYRIEADDPNFVSLLQHEMDHLDGHLYIDRMPAGAKLVPKPGMPKIP